MRSALSAGILMVVIAIASIGAYLLAKHNAAAASMSAGTPSLGAQALGAYRSGDYAKAVPLLKQYAQSPEIRDDKVRLNEILTDIVNAESKLAPAAAAASTTGPTMNAAVAGDPANIDPSTSKPRIPHPPIPTGQIATMTIRELGNFEFDPTANMDIPVDIKALNGATVRLRGFMVPLNQAEDITDFALFPTLANCCFGQPPGVQHTITCKTEKGKAVQYTVDEIWVVGKLAVHLQKDQGYTYSIFDLEVSSVKPAE